MDAILYEPTSGTIKRPDRIVNLFDLVQGMLDELPGRDNILVRGMLLGASKAEMGRKVDEIIEFAELEEYAHLPLRAYSAGMRLRLAFAVCTSIEADVVTNVAVTARQPEEEKMPEAIEQDLLQ